MTSFPGAKGSRFEWRFEMLLVLLLVWLALAPIVGNGVILGLCATAVFISAVTALRESRLMRWVSWILVVIGLVALWTAELSGRIEWVILSSALGCAFYALMVVGILTYVYRAEIIDGNVLSAAICAYLLMGLGWTDLFMIIENADPGSFSSGSLAIGGLEDLASPRLQQSHFSYFSLVTLSTLGYGDITPLKPAARNLAALEAIIGQLFIGVLVARLVSQQVRRDRGREKKC